MAQRWPSDATNDLLGGRLTVQPDSLGSATRLIRGGRTKPLVILSGARTPLLPSVPTMQELGYKDFDFNGWIGVLAPAGTPEAIVERPHPRFEWIVAVPCIAEMLAELLTPLSVSEGGQFLI